MLDLDSYHQEIIKTCGDIFEAFCGAIFLDTEMNYEETKISK